MPDGRRAPASFLLVLLLAASPAVAQNNSAATVDVPAPPAPRADTVGPEQLRDFSLPGTVTRRSDEQPASRTAPATGSPSTTATRSTPAQPTSSANRPPPATQPAGTAEATPPAAPGPTQAPAETAAPAPSLSLDLPPPTPAQEFSPPITSPNDLGPPSTDAPLQESTTASSAPRLWPWLLLAALAGIAGLLWFRRGSSRSEGGRYGELAFAGSAPAPEPAPAPTPPPAPPLRPAADIPPPLRPAAETPPPPPAPVGIVSTRLRPWIDLEFAPLRAVLTDTEVVIDFEIVVRNSGSMPARQVIVEAVIINAGEEQEEALNAFFARPEIPGDGIDAVPPLGTLPLQSQVRLQRAAMREYAVEGRRLFVPIVSFNAAYRWSSGAGRTSAAFLVGVGQPGADKLGPLRVDQGPREWRSVAAKLLPSGVRR
ncbi:hypothetical protein [Sphingomonas arenae]|uniref:hypothetical protein n=1 Tax=Sphingomonas arenae TaxID=2812555 RepID=UPI0019672A2D|nr:hypothetical protein [Sphingomonas arenae]